MTFTAKEDYGLRAVLVLAAAWSSDRPSATRSTMQARDIAAAEHIPEPFLEQVLATLRRAGLVNAIRGSSGGYELAREPDKITAADVLRALSGPLVPSKLLEPKGATAKRAVVCVSVWSAVDRCLAETLERVTLTNLLDDSRAAILGDSYGMNI